MEDSGTFACAHCGSIHPPEELRVFGGELYCRDCLNELTEICDHCGERFRISELCNEQSLPPFSTARSIAISAWTWKSTAPGSAMTVPSD